MDGVERMTAETALHDAAIEYARAMDRLNQNPGSAGHQRVAELAEKSLRVLAVRYARESTK